MQRYYYYCYYYYYYYYYILSPVGKLPDQTGTAASYSSGKEGSLPGFRAAEA
jgi:hypothetical protein